MRTRPKIEFSKIIMLVAGAVNLWVIGFSCVMIWKTFDLTPLAYLIPAVAAEVATGTGFYYNKAKLENKLKLMASYNLTPSEEDIKGEEGTVG